LPLKNLIYYLCNSIGIYKWFCKEYTLLEVNVLLGWLPVSFTHILLTLLVVVIWGVNFIFIKWGLDQFPPLLLCATRFLLSSVPIVFFIRFPAAPVRMIVLYGLIMFALQFALFFFGMSVGMTPGMASLIMQLQVFFSMFFAAIFLKEIPFIWQIIGSIVSFMGIGIIALHADKNISLMGLILLVCAAATWGLGNLIVKKIQHVNMMSLVVWGNFIACIPMLALSAYFEGINNIIHVYTHLTWISIGSVFYIAYISTWIGYSAWSWLLSRHPVGEVVPFALLIPVVGILSSVIILHEPLQLWKLFAGLLVMGGLGINLLGTRLFIKKTEPQLG